MSEVLSSYDTVLRGQDGKRYGAQACGRERDDGMWEGWVEFLPGDGGEPVRTGRETTQPNRDDILYWASGLTDPYLDGALLRALRGPGPKHPPASAAPSFSAPAPRKAPPTPTAPVGAASAAAYAAAARPHAILDPFHVYSEGDHILRGQLAALSAGQLRNIIKAYDLSSLTAEQLDGMNDAALIHLIVTAVEKTSG
jgi:hypothetical protein